MGGQGNNKKVKVDISRNEQLVFELIMKSAFINYSDLEVHQLLCYSLEEVLVEKLRSIIQRMQARDFFFRYLVSPRRTPNGCSVLHK